MNPEQVFIFTGPTLSPKEALDHLGAIYLPPARLGDIYRVCELYQPAIIGLIDGYFNQVPAVWHKELLQAMHRGVKLFGASSMGALRAAEMHPFGMVGVGTVFEAYRDGLLPPFTDEVFEDDDEVAVIHGPAELGYPAASDAMVNIRVTLARALGQGVIGDALFGQLTRLAKQRFYAERNYHRLLDDAEQATGQPIAELRDWLANHSIDQKKADAITLLQTIAALPDSSIETTPDHDIPGFELTHQWQAAIDDIEQSQREANPVLDELRLRGEAYFEAEDIVLAASIGEAAPPLVPDGLTDLHNAPGQLQQRFSRDWLRKAAQADTGQPSHLQLDAMLLAHLEGTGELETLKARAERKRKMLAEKTQKPSLDDLNDLHILQLSDWYFSTCLQSDIPDSIESYSASLGFEEADEFYAMILGEYLYLDAESQQRESSAQI